MLRSAVALALLASATQVTAAGSRITLEEGVVRVRPAAALSTLEVFVEGAAGLPPLLGEMRLEGDALSFEPRFALRPGMRYRVVYHEAKQAAPVVAVLEVPAGPARPPTALVRIDPSPDLLPENLLKLYFHFSAPMSRGEAYRRIRLLDERGAALELPFLEIDQELWDPEARRLTLLFDPGRVKRELVPHQEVGPPLRAGSAYTLVVDRDWPDAQGNALVSEARKTFRVGPPDHTPPRTTDWRLGLPTPGTRAPLVVTFPEPLDRALLERVLDVQDGSGDPVSGAVAVVGGDTRWSFTPREP
ncbi:MAG TPA: hypothetical protein VI669_19675, partial [Vicinamibacteria bacterium]